MKFASLAIIGLALLAYYAAAAIVIVGNMVAPERAMLDRP
jgi:hypothetical protein